MSEFLPALHEGHAPITLHELFRDALETYEAWEEGEAEPVVTFEGKVVPIRAVFEHMSACTDILPQNMMGVITDRLTKKWNGSGPLDEMTFSTAARVMAVLYRKRLRSHASGDIGHFLETWVNRYGEGIQA
ncbi:BRA0787 family protein [Ensifer soli]|uniref:hypothetical protein n=1 Tax=Ciceribacter sp. sgz301302 TaxID=3342379 RepID=UPI0035B92549